MFSIHAHRVTDEEPGDGDRNQCDREPTTTLMRIAGFVLGWAFLSIAMASANERGRRWLRRFAVPNGVSLPRPRGAEPLPERRHPRRSRLGPGFPAPMVSLAGRSALRIVPPVRLSDRRSCFSVPVETGRESRSLIDSLPGKPYRANLSDSIRPSAQRQTPVRTAQFRLRPVTSLIKSPSIGVHRRVDRLPRFPTRRG